MKELSWQQFDQAVRALASHFNGIVCSGVFGVPRGGLCLAVALSHALERPLLLEPAADALIVDDVYETGRTLEALREQFPDAFFAVWVSKCQVRWWTTVEVSAAEEWLVFPWEIAEKASADEAAYKAKRSSVKGSGS